MSKLFNISRNTINLWLQRRARTGDFQANNKKIPRSDRKISDWEKFRSFVKMHGDKTQKEMAELWEDDISQRTISRGLQKIGFTRKKRLMVTAKGMNSKDNSF